VTRGEEGPTLAGILTWRLICTDFAAARHDVNMGSCGPEGKIATDGR
jgi:hypothetical protein